MILLLLQSYHHDKIGEYRSNRKAMLTETSGNRNGNRARGREQSREMDEQCK